MRHASPPDSYTVSIRAKQRAWHYQHGGFQLDEECREECCRKECPWHRPAASQLTRGQFPRTQISETLKRDQRYIGRGGVHWRPIGNGHEFGSVPLQLANWPEHAALSETSPNLL